MATNAYQIKECRAMRLQQQQQQLRQQQLQQQGVAMALDSACMLEGFAASFSLKSAPIGICAAFQSL